MSALCCRKTKENFDTDEPQFNFGEPSNEPAFCPCGPHECILHAEGDTGFLQTVESPASKPLPLPTELILYMAIENGVSA